MKKIFLIVNLILLFASLSYSLNTGLINQNPFKYSRKLEHHLTLSLDFYIEYQTSSKSQEDFNLMLDGINTLSKTISIKFDKQNEPLVDVIIKSKSSGWITSNKNILFPKVIAGERNDFIVCSLYLNKLSSILENSDVIFIEPAFHLKDTLNDSVIDIGADQVWSGGQNGDDSITGSDVYVGIIDSEPLKTHETFLNGDNECRFDDNFNDFSVSNPQNHGTAVASIAAGIGVASQIKGVAYNSTILWKEKGTSTEMILAFSDMIDYTGNDPLVVNLSQGFYLGPHDGTTLFEQTLNYMINDNKILVVSAGNFNEFNNHLRMTIIDDQVKTVNISNLPNGTLVNNEFELEFWFDEDTSLDVRVKGPNSEYSNWITPNNSNTTPYETYTLGDGKVKVYNGSQTQNDFFEERSNVIYMNFWKPLFVTIIDTGVYSIEFRINENSSIDDVTIDGYTTYYSTIDNNGTISYIPGNFFLNNSDYSENEFVVDSKQSILSPGYTERAITVGACQKENFGGNIASYSSTGPKRNDYSEFVGKPDLVAPGGDGSNPQDLSKILCASAGNNSSFFHVDGTSMAAPHVTGGIALIMQFFPNLSYQQIKQLVRESTISPSNMTYEERVKWGSGKFNIHESFKNLVGYLNGINDYPAFKNVFLSNNCISGLPIEIVQWNWNSIAKQKMTNGAIVSSDNCPFDAVWLGEEIWQKWIELGHVNSLLGMPITSEYIDASNSNFHTVDFENGRAYFNNQVVIITENNIVIPCASPQNINISNQQNSIQLSWDPVTVDMNGNPVTPDFYNVYRSDTSPDGSYELIGTTTNSFYTLDDSRSVVDKAFIKVTAEKESSGITDPNFVLVPGGTFTMGRTTGSGGSDELPTHQVTLSSFYIGKYEVTQAEYQAVMGTNPSYFSGSDKPVEGVTWYNAVQYCNARSIEEGLTPCYNTTTWECDFSANGYRLLTEAEWEYAARGGTNNPDYLYSGSDDIHSVAWYGHNSGRTTHNVGTKAPNSLGIYDMSGNVWEWCNDRYGSYSSSALTDPVGPATGSGRVNRGGSWDGSATNCRVAFRIESFPADGYDIVGFRLARSSN
ncbi:SUMF1/EgtB/PvdO family nonheme iron enzyme [bacterium]|nr:SUMF1/EgtB/PvdO family nonheme iron enzyme [bacterium]